MTEATKRAGSGPSAAPAGVRVVLLDRDGVLNADRVDFVTSVSELEVIPGAAEGAHALSDAGYRLVVSNQSCVGRGLVDRATVDAVNEELDRRLGGTIAAWYLCPHAPEEGCACRKPGTGLLEAARADWGFDPGTTWFVADAERDVVAARRFGCRPALVRTGKGRAAARALPEVPAFDDLADFARRILD